MKTLYRYHCDCGRMGSIDGLFIADTSEVEEAIGKEVYFGEILGKHSEISGTLEANEFTILSQDQEKIEWLQSITGADVSGYNPLSYIEE